MDFLSHKEKYEETVRKACVVYKKLKEIRKATGSIDISRYNIHYIKLCQPHGLMSSEGVTEEY